MILPADLGCALVFLAFTQAKIFRHTGMGLQFYKGGKHRIVHARRNTNYFRTLVSDWVKVLFRLFYFLVRIVFVYHTCCVANFRANHGYPAYWLRLGENANALQQLSLSGLYDDFDKEKDRQFVELRYW